MYFVSQCLHPAIPTSARFLLEIFLNFLFLFFFSVLSKRIVTVNRITSTKCFLTYHNTKWRPTASLLKSAPRKSAGVKSELRSKLSTKAPSQEDSLATGGSFKRNTYRVTALDWLKKERKKMNDSEFRPFQVCHFKIVTTRCHCYCRLGQALEPFHCRFRSCAAENKQ